jgi:hypothetical protein
MTAHEMATAGRIGDGDGDATRFGLHETGTSKEGRSRNISSRQSPVATCASGSLSGLARSASIPIFEIATQRTDRVIVY